MSPKGLLTASCLERNLIIKHFLHVSPSFIDSVIIICGFGVFLCFCFSLEPLRSVEKWPEWPFPGATNIRAGPGAQRSQESSLTSFEKGVLKPSLYFAWWLVKRFLTFWSELSKTLCFPLKVFLSNHRLNSWNIWEVFSFPVWWGWVRLSELLF